MNALEPFTVPALLDTYMRSRQSGPRPVMAFSQETRAAYAAGIRAVIALQRKWDDLTVDEAVAELRKGEESLFHPLFKDDPTVFADCETCRRRVVVGVEGFCGDCSRDLVGVLA